MSKANSKFFQEKPRANGRNIVSQQLPTLLPLAFSDSRKLYLVIRQNFIKFETASITSDYICTTYFKHFISSLVDNTNAPRKNEQYFYFSLTLKDIDVCPPSKPVKT